MKIMVFDVPAESDGALTILNQYYEAALKDTRNEWIFIISTPRLENRKNIKIINYPWIKKSWIHRLFFDNFVASRLTKLHGADEVLSLQNIIIPNVNVKQTLYLHQSLPFVEKKYGILENFKFWVIQNIISIFIFKSVKNADKIIVQTNWLKEICVNKLKVDSRKIKIEIPKINIEALKLYKKEGDTLLFFYPAAEMAYKNHKIIIDAIKLFKADEFKNIRIIFTLNGNENKEIKDIYDTVYKYNLPIEFIGKISQDLVYSYYSKSILIFPSYIETLGLPLLEAKIHRSPILVSDCSYARETLNDYNQVDFFNPFDSKELFNLMKKYINK